jgi:hypothetical protein
MMTIRSNQTRSPRNYIANIARLEVTLRMTATSGMKIPTPTVDDSTMRPRTAGTKTSQSRIKAREREIYASMLETRRQMLQIVTHSSHQS